MTTTKQQLEKVYRLHKAEFRLWNFATTIQNNKELSAKVALKASVLSGYISGLIFITDIDLGGEL